MKLNTSVTTVKFVATSRSTSKEPIYHEKSTKKVLKRLTNQFCQGYNRYAKSYNAATDP